MPGNILLRITYEQTNTSYEKPSKQKSPARTDYGWQLIASLMLGWISVVTGSLVKLVHLRIYEN